MPISAMEIGPLNEERVRRAFEAAAELGIPVINIGPSGKTGVPGGLEGILSVWPRWLRKPSNMACASV